MLYKVDFLNDAAAFRVNKNIFYFLIRIENVAINARFTLKYFRADFAKAIDRAEELEKKLKDFFDKFKKLDIADRQLVILAFKKSQFIATIIADLTYDGNSLKLGSLPPSIRAATARLFSYLYKTTLKKYKIANYKRLYETIPSKICPFCGLEKLNHPDLYNQDYDHLLYKGMYPFASINMRNLFPMGSDCNQKYKTTKDILYDKTGIRRSFTDPYEGYLNISFSLVGSILPRGGVDKGSWVLAISPDNAFTITWNNVFSIKDRYIKNELEQSFSTWLGYFKTSLKKRGKGWDEPAVRRELQMSGDSYLENPNDISNLVKGALFAHLAVIDDDIFFSALLIELNLTP